MNVGKPYKIAKIQRQAFSEIRAYCGDFSVSGANGLPSRGDLPGDQASALQVAGCRFVSIDRFTTAWAVDQNVNLWGDAVHTASWHVVLRRGLNIHSLRKNRHPKQLLHGCGSLCGYVGRDFLYWGCVHAHHWARALFDVTPDIWDVLAEAANCVVYNWQQEVFKCVATPRAVNGGFRGLVNLRGCIFIPGPDTPELRSSMFNTGGHPYFIEDCWVLKDGNYIDLREFLSPSDHKAMSSYRHPMDFSFAGYNPNELLPANNPTTLEKLLLDVGPMNKNTYELLVLNDVRSRSGKIIDSQDELWNELL